MNPKYLLVQLIFEDDNLTQSTMIDLTGAKSISTHNTPVFKEREFEVAGLDGLDRTKLMQNIYSFIIDYGEEGISIKNEEEAS